MAEHAARLARIFTPTYARLVNAQIVHPVSSVVVKPTELIGALARPRNVAVYEPHHPAAYLAATLSYGIIMGTFYILACHPFMDGNKRTAFFLANAYMRAMGLRLPGIADEVELGEAAMRIADQHVFCAAATSGLDKLAASMGADIDAASHESE
ncbi:hypothetical protein EXIGLDRAFT_600147 [Exidia glandulosa HHB12029]|uniref:Fido domain-containing protein n=1 Tax=Exidia glandulosa HHB12029 TaxID=1314781 RepID=A0A165QZL8_EXIGL|nr:hypothetical protein EXIGLDRAFT_600147 [Exidia glandulosa HHB12029]